MPYEDTKIKIIHIKQARENVYKRFPKPYLQFMELHFKQWKRGNQRAPHKPLLFLYALGQWQQGVKELHWNTTAPVLTQLLHQFGSNASKQSPENPWGRLVSDGFWTLQPAAKLINGNFHAREFERLNSTGSLSNEVQRELQNNPELLITWVWEILNEQFPSSLHADLLSACGLEMEPTTVAKQKRKRDPNFAQSVLANYQYQCAVCGYNLQLNRQSIGLEAAHIQWHAYDGPDNVTNGLALCALHHKLFDFGAFALTDDLNIIVSPKLHGSHSQTLANHHNQALFRNNIQFEEPSKEHVQWQRSQVFKR
jgi:putative restriction endonuclease